jgi:hypothetical protein
MALCGAARLVFATYVCALSVVAQDRISVGVKGGIPLNDPFADRTFNYIVGTIRNPFGPPSVISGSTRTYSDSRSFVLGPSIEVQLPLGLSVEVDALYRPLYLATQQTTTTRGFFLSTPPLETRIDTWVFPFLAKYRLPVPGIRPYVEAGPSFRAISGLLAQHMSGKGFTAGIGVESTVGHFRITPEVRYTRWGADAAYNTLYHAVARQSQIELLAGLAPQSGASNTPQTISGWRQRLSIGVKGGLPFTTAFLSDAFGRVSFPPVVCGDFINTSCTTANATVQMYRASRNYLIGAMVEVHITDNFSIESDVMHAPLSLAASGPATGLAGFLLGPSIQTFDSWQFPTQAIYRFRGSFVRPYLEAGPTFRSTSSPFGSYLSNTGVTAGLGVQAAAWKLRISPEVRFVHWGQDAPGASFFYASRRNQAQFLLGLSY